jgi:cellulose synthase/poly-beta-1,6-N-acetylglucosamine synthase-like glycosyltransferase
MGLPIHFASNTLQLTISRLNWLFFWYYAGSTVSYCALIVLAYVYSRRHLHVARSRGFDGLRQHMPRVTIIAPAKNEQACILGAARSFLALDYAHLDVVFVDDESTDLTFELLRTTYQLRRDDSPVISTLPHKPITSVWRSASDPRLAVVRKLSAGFKGDATNAALEIAAGEYVIVTDTDSLLENNAVRRIVAVVLEHPTTVAVGGNLHIVNGCVITRGQLQRVRRPRHYFETMQVIEYARAFFMSRLGWSFLNMTPNISGAFGLFRTDILRAVGGYRNVLAEDMDMTLRIHRHILDNRLSNQIRFAPDAKVWTEVPRDYKSVASQRVRWHNSLCDVLWSFRSMLWQPRYGRIGFILLPWLWTYEWIAPFVELLGWSSIGLAAIAHCLHWPAALVIGGGYVFTMVLSVLAILHGEGKYPRYSLANKTNLILQTVLEIFPYRFLYVYWRLRGQVQYFRGDRRWPTVARIGFDGTEYQKTGD